MNDRWTQIIRGFAAAMAAKGQSAGVYEARGAYKACDDIAVGKRGEVLVYQALREHGCSEPDFSVLDYKRKNWSADLMLGDTPLHVKTCSARTRYIVGTRSWTFQESDPIFSDGGFVIFAYCESWRSFGGWVSRIYDFTNEIEPKLGKPREVKYHGTKRCILQADLPE